MSLVTLIVALVLIGLLFWVVRTLSAAFSIPQPVVTVIYVVLVVINRALALAGVGPHVRWTDPQTQVGAVHDGPVEVR